MHAMAEEDAEDYSKKADDTFRTFKEEEAAAEEAAKNAPPPAQEKPKPPPELRFQLQLLNEKANNVTLALQNLQMQVNTQVQRQQQLQEEMNKYRHDILTKYGVDIATHYINDNNEFVPNPQQVG